MESVEKLNMPQVFNLYKKQSLSQVNNPIRFQVSIKWKKNKNMYRRKALYLKFTFFQFLFKYVSLFAIFSSDSNFQSMKYRVMS